MYWKQADKKLLKLKEMQTEISITGNKILIKGEGSILADSLQGRAIGLTHSWTHAGERGMAHQLRYHFFIYDMGSTISAFIRDCSCCKFIDKKSANPIQSHMVPIRC